MACVNTRVNFAVSASKAFPRKDVRRADQGLDDAWFKKIAIFSIPLSKTVAAFNTPLATLSCKVVPAGNFASTVSLLLIKLYRSHACKALKSETVGQGTAADFIYRDSGVLLFSRGVI